MHVVALLYCCLKIPRDHNVAALYDDNVAALYDEVCAVKNCQLFSLVVSVAS